ncbi:class III signal peptide-containing protein [Candidatus Woesearchaeota archaeon]|nr:class III signal peptide-containing protein [Candidatus Woesearchaeota archaeon]
MHKKAQTATEYLIILAVVIIIALIVVGVMGGIPGIGGGAGARTSASYWATTDVAFTSYSVISDTSATNPGQVTLVVRNNQENSVEITSILLGTAEMIAAGSSITLNPGQSITHTGNALVACSTSYSFPVTIVYTDNVLSQSFSFTGDQNLMGNCAT